MPVLIYIYIVGEWDNACIIYIVGEWDNACNDISIL